MCRWNLNPKMGALQTQPTVSPTLIHHIQRGNVKIVPNIKVWVGYFVMLSTFAVNLFCEPAKASSDVV